MSPVQIGVFAALGCRSVLLVQSNAAVVLERFLARDCATNWGIQEVEAFTRAGALRSALVVDPLGASFILLTKPAAEEFDAQPLEQWSAFRIPAKSVYCHCRLQQASF